MERIFNGLYTALITPFSSDGSIDENSLFHLIDLQLSANVDGIVILGTTGESPTISSEEKKQLINRTVQYINNRCQVIIGTGSYCTRTTIENSKYAESAGADGLLVVNPYYNKPTQKGLYAHFRAVAEAVSIPVIVYNIEGRTGVNVHTETLVRLAEIPNIVAVKEASGDMEQIKEVINSVPPGFSVLSGDDGITLDLIKNGGHGLVSVISNLLPFQMKDFVQTCLNGDEARAILNYNQLTPLFEASFMETNPQPLKTMMADVGLCEEVFRLPLTTMEPVNRKRLLKLWHSWKSEHIVQMQVA